MPSGELVVPEGAHLRPGTLGQPPEDEEISGRPAPLQARPAAKGPPQFRVRRRQKIRGRVEDPVHAGEGALLAQVVSDLADGSTDLSSSTRCRRARAELNLKMSARPAEERLREDTEHEAIVHVSVALQQSIGCLLYTSPSPRDRTRSRMPSSA